MSSARTLPALLLLATLALPAGVASAQTAARTAPIERHGPADDDVKLELSVEDWVETKTATVRIVADLAVESGRFGAARQDFVSTLQGFGTSAEWRIVSFSKLGDDAGFERWHLVAEARVAEAALSDLAGKAKQATRPGRALSIGSIEYMPTLAEREAVIDRLRAQVYARAAREIAALEQAFLGRKFRIRLIDFTPVFQPPPQRMSAAMAPTLAAEAKAADGGGLAGAEKARLTARVTLVATAPGE